MAKHTRRPQQRTHSKPTVEAPAVVAAAHRLAAAIEAFAVVASQDTQLRGVLELPYLFQDLRAVGADGTAVITARQLDQAWRIIASDAPVSDLLPSRRSAGEPEDLFTPDGRVTGHEGEAYRWRGPLPPISLIRAAAAAGPDDPGYRVQLERNAAFYAARVYDGEAHCGRPTKAGGACAFVPVWFPGEGFSDGTPCYRHMTDEETEQACALYDAAVALHACPGCGAPAGKKCGEDRITPVDGAWPRLRSYRGRRVHDARLNLTL